MKLAFLLCAAPLKAFKARSWYRGVGWALYCGILEFVI